ncbi:hypothetical protein TREES_T100019483 [Tupaia chinensis]|uniref:Uncharacterized protein n=1 Tax=Tupaia chinensis TaxID=246437 RepID=L9KHX3_TUPCH|nr:hypothetical protein TREES_T100019483 [Tupaia chinensis]
MSCAFMERRGQIRFPLPYSWSCGGLPETLSGSPVILHQWTQFNFLIVGGPENETWQMIFTKVINSWLGKSGSLSSLNQTVFKEGAVELLSVQKGVAALGPKPFCRG